jgi:hypothetical protein
VGRRSVFLRRTGLLFWAGLSLCLCAIAALAAGSAFAKSEPPKHVGRCNAHRKHATAATGKVIVYGKPSGEDAWGGALTTYYACLRPAGEPVAVGQSAASGGGLPADEFVSDLHIAGTFVADSSGRGFAAEADCSKEQPIEPVTVDCSQSVTLWVEIADAKTRRRLHAPVDEGPATVAVSSVGAVAWVQGTGSASMLQAIVLHHGSPGRLTGTAQTVDTGAIGHSLQFDGLTLRWTNSGQAKSQPVS